MIKKSSNIDKEHRAMATYYDHASSDTIELYALGRLPESEMSMFEEHLLICSECQDALKREDEFRQAIVQALKDPLQP